MPAEDDKPFRRASAVIAQAFDGIESLAILPREIEDILQISSTERHRWLKDGRLRSAGTRTVKLRGRARQVTFHVFDPRVVEDLLDRDTVSEWREEDALTAVENRRRAAWKAKLSRSVKTEVAPEPALGSPSGETGPNLLGWDEFERHGPLRSR